MTEPTERPAVILSFDVEEHDRIEAAHGLTCPPEAQRDYADRMERDTYRLLDVLAESGARATFFILGQIARDRPALVRDVADAGHEIASHGWDHRRVCHFTPAELLEDLRVSKDELEQVSGRPVYGYRAPTFSIYHRTGWAID